MILLTVTPHLFDLGHILYISISAVLTCVILILARMLIKSQSSKNLFLRLWAIFTVVIHYSVIYVDFLSSGKLQIGENMIFAIHPCNVCMWLLLAVSLIKKQDTAVFRIIAEFVFWAGTICGIIGIVLNENYAALGLGNYEAFKGLLSHSTMIIGSLYMLVGGYIRIRVFNVVSVISGLILFVVNGAFINGIYKLFDRGEPNSMYLQKPPFPDMPWLNTVFIGIIAVFVCFIITSLYEQIALKRDERWYARLQKIYEEKYKEKK